MEETHTELSRYLADRLQGQIDGIVDEWVVWLRERIGGRAVKGLPEAALRNHIPPILAALAAYLRTPVEAVGTETLGHLRLHAHLRREQGWDIQQLLVEFDHLAALVMGRMVRAVAEFPGQASAAAVAQAFTLLSTGLRAVGFVTVGTYREREQALASDLSRRLEEFASALVHEVRQPLNAVALGARLLGTEAVGHDAKSRAEYSDMILRSLERAGDLIEDLRMLALAEGARVEPRWAPLKALVEEVFEQMRPVASERGVELRVEEPLPAVEVDSLGAQLALLNLVGNAIKYSDRGKEAREVVVAVTWEDGEEQAAACEIRVRDNGIGIPAEYRDHVFERHFRAHPEHADGLGLGLSIARQSVHQIGGRLWLESSSPEGSVFCLRMQARGELVRPPGETAAPARILERAAEESLELGEPPPGAPGGPDDAAPPRAPEPEAG